MAEPVEIHHMTPGTTGKRSGIVTGARWALAVLAILFTLGALGQFFLVGLSIFEDGARWNDHKTLGHILGLLPYVMWLPAVIGRTGIRVILGTLALLVLFMAQYAFIHSGNGVAMALPPLNGTFLLLLGHWIAQRAFRLVRQPALPDRMSAPGRA